MLIRPARPDDAEERAALASTCYPHVLVSAHMIRYHLPDPALRSLSVVAEVEGHVVGSGTLRLEVLDRSTAAETISVARGARRRGIGSAIHAALAEHLATLTATRLKGRVTSTEGRAFAEHHGFTPGRVWRVSGVDPRLAPPVPRIPEGIALKPLSAVEDLKAVHDLYNACGADMPGNDGRADFSYDDWLRFAVNSPVADRDCSIVAFDGATPVALTFINSSGDRAFNSLAGTARDHRGEGLGKLVKAVSLHKAAAKGVTRVYTANAGDNAPMLAVNTWLGYVPALEELTMVREVPKTA